MSEAAGRLFGRNRTRRAGVLKANEPNVDTPLRPPIKWRFFKGRTDREVPAVTLIKIIIITLAVILSILLFGRFLF